MYSILKLNERLTYLSLACFHFMVKFATCRGESHKQINFMVMFATGEKVTDI